MPKPLLGAAIFVVLGVPRRRPGAAGQQRASSPHIRGGALARNDTRAGGLPPPRRRPSARRRPPRLRRRRNRARRLAASCVTWAATTSTSSRRRRPTGTSGASAPRASCTRLTRHRRGNGRADGRRRARSRGATSRQPDPAGAARRWVVGRQPHGGQHARRRRGARPRARADQCDVVCLRVEVAVDRTRPNGDPRSFPSGHAAATFATAMVLQDHYGWKVGVPFFAASTYTAMSRLTINKHWASTSPSAHSSASPRPGRSRCTCGTASSPWSRSRCREVAAWREGGVARPLRPCFSGTHDYRMIIGSTVGHATCEWLEAQPRADGRQGE